MAIVIGHKNPDTDTTVSAIVYAYYKNQITKSENYKPARAGELNEETKLALKKFGFSEPELVVNGEDKELVLVDHNEPKQMIDNANNIIEVLDHHKVSLQTSKPILFHTEPVGSTSTIIAKKMIKDGLVIPNNMAGLLLSGILSDTVIFKSATTTQEDKSIALRLAEQLNINAEEYGMELKKAKSSIKNKTSREVIMSDFKKFDTNNYSYGIGQLEVVDYDEANERKNEIISELERIRVEEGLRTAMLMVTNILRNETRLWFTGDEEVIKKAFNKEPKNNEVLLEGVMSRKKQVVPPIDEALK